MGDIANQSPKLSRKPNGKSKLDIASKMGGGAGLVGGRTKKTSRMKDIECVHGHRDHRPVKDIEVYLGFDDLAGPSVCKLAVVRWIKESGWPKEESERSFRKEGH